MANIHEHNDACKAHMRELIKQGLDENKEPNLIKREVIAECKKGFDGVDKVDILNIDAASEIPKAPPQKHEENQRFLKGPLVGSSGDATTHFAPARDWRRATLQNRSFSQGF